MVGLRATVLTLTHTHAHTHTPTPTNTHTHETQRARKPFGVVGRVVCPTAKARSSPASQKAIWRRGTSGVSYHQSTKLALTLGRWHGAPLSCRDVRRDVRREVQSLKHHGQRAVGARFAVAPNMATAAVSVEHIDEVRRDHICPEESTQLRQLAQFADPASACSPSRALASLTPPRAWVRQYPGLQRLQAGIAGNFLAPCG